MVETLYKILWFLTDKAYAASPAAEKACQSTGGTSVSVGVNPGIGTSMGDGKYTYCEYIYTIYDTAIKFGSVLTVIMVIYAGYLYIFSQGDNSRLNTAKEIFIGAVSGYALLLVIGLILNFLGLPYFPVK